MSDATSKQLESLTAAINGLLQLQLAQRNGEQQATPQNNTLSHTETYNHLSARVEKYQFGSGDEVIPFTKWLLRHEYTVTTEAACLPPQMQTRLVLDKLGQTEFDRLVDHIAPTDPTRMSQGELITTLKELFRDKVPITRRRIEILNYRYDKSIPITEHLDRINRHAADFDRSNLTDDNLRILLLLQSFCYSRDNDELKKIALRVIEKNQDASLRDVVAELEAHMNVSSGLKILENPTKHLPASVLRISQSRKKNVSTRKPVSEEVRKTSVANSKCNGCGGAHPRAKCTFRDAICYKCSTKGHISKVCRSNAEQVKVTAKTGSVKIQSLSSVDKSRRQYVTVSLLGNHISLQYDSGSDITVIGKQKWIRLGSPKLVTSDTVVHAGGNNLDVIGKFQCSIKALGRTGNIYINVASRNDINLFGLNAIDSLDLWSVPLSELHQSNAIHGEHSVEASAGAPVRASSKPASTKNITNEQSNNTLKKANCEVTTPEHEMYLENVLQRFPHLFAKELGTCSNFKAKFNLANDARPVQTPCRQIPFAMESLLQEELTRLVSDDIIEPVETSNWTSPIVLAKKQNGKIRLCVDFSTGVNNAITDNKHPLPTVENIMSKLNGSRFFSILDLSDAFFQLEIEEAHREITTITTPKGLFRFKRLPFGIKTAPATFQQAMDTTLTNLEGVYAYLDDIVVLGSTQQEHDDRLRKTLQRLQDRGWKLRAEKCRFALKEIKYLGFIINSQGISTDPEAIRAIVDMPNPTSVQEVQSFLGMVNHYGKFIPHLHQMKRPLEELTHKNHPWIWNRTHDSAIEQIKKVMLSPLLLEHFDPTKTMIVAADACTTGIGAVLLQRDDNGNERAVYHMAQSLTDAQRNYSQLEKEALVLVTAVERFHKFVWGRRFILQTDHKPLVALLQTDNTKGLKPTTAARLKRWALRLLGYDFKIEYIRTQDFGQADALSRLIDKFRRDNAEELQVACIRETESELLQIKNRSIDFFGEDLRGKLKAATKEDPLLRSVLQAITKGWKSKVNANLEPFKRRSEDLSIIDDTLLLGDRVVIPEKLRATILAALHKGHPGIRRTKQLAREYVFWPKMTEDIERLVHQCDPCALNQKLPVKVPLDPWPAPTRPMERVHLDYAGPIDGHYLLIFVDAYSKFIDVATTTTISANRTVDLCREFFCRFGPPDVLVTDHGTQFTSELFSTFCKEMQISHLLSPVNHPQSNGQAERMVDTVKRAIAKDPSNWKRQLQDFLYSYRYTPCSSAAEGKAPAELLFGRRINSPFTKWLPRMETPEPTTGDLAAEKQSMRKQFAEHHGARPRHLAIGDRVVVLSRKDKREQGVIIKTTSKTNFSVRLDDGKIISRHINHIWKGGSPPPTSPKPQDDDWIFYQPSVEHPPQQESPVAAETYHQSEALPTTQMPADRNLDPPENHQTPTRPARNRMASRRLILDPSAKSYTQR